MARYELIWQERTQYKVTFQTDQQWESFVKSLDENLDPTDLDVVYKHLNMDRGLSSEYLHDMATNENWFNTIDYEIDDLERIPDETAAET